MNNVLIIKCPKCENQLEPSSLDWCYRCNLKIPGIEKIEVPMTLREDYEKEKNTVVHQNYRSHSQRRYTKHLESNLNASQTIIGQQKHDYGVLFDKASELEIKLQGSITKVEELRGWRELALEERRTVIGLRSELLVLKVELGKEKTKNSKLKF